MNIMRDDLFLLGKNIALQFVTMLSLEIVAPSHYNVELSPMGHLALTWGQLKDAMSSVMDLMHMPYYNTLW